LGVVDNFAVMFATHLSLFTSDLGYLRTLVV